MFHILLASAALSATLTPCDDQMPNLNPATLEYLRRVDRPAAQKMAPAKLGYARIVADYQTCPVATGYDRKYETERRDIIQRFFMQKEVSKALIAKVSVRPLGVSASSTLVSMGRNSGKQGETWSTDVGNSLTILPYFRIEPNTTLQLTASYDTERTYNSSVAGDTIDIIDRATKLIAPSTPLITASNKARFNDASSFVDSTINGLLKVDIKENLRADTLIGDGDIVLAKLVLYTTGANDPFARRQAEYPRPVGMWTIRAETFAGSLFTGGDGDKDTPSVASVLNFEVTDGKRIREMLAGDTIVSAARDALEKATGEGKKGPAGTLCRALAARADGEGFSAQDVNWIVAAYVADMTPVADTNIKAGCPFRTALDRIYGKEQESKLAVK